MSHDLLIGIIVGIVIGWFSLTGFLAFVLHMEHKYNYLEDLANAKALFDTETDQSLEIASH